MLGDQAGNVAGPRSKALPLFLDNSRLIGRGGRDPGTSGQLGHAHMSKY